MAAEEQTDEFRQIYEALLSLKDEVEVYLREENNVQDDQEDTEVSDADKERLIAEAKEKYGDILDQIIESLDSGTLEPTCYYTEDFIDFVNSLETPLYWQIDDGRYVGLYSTGDGIYLGEMKNGLCSGWGFFYTENNWDSVSQLWLYTGSWSEDYPNGLGTYESVSMRVVVMCTGQKPREIIIMVMKMEQCIKLIQVLTTITHLRTMQLMEYLK